jgi:hypothetical protein
MKTLNIAISDIEYARLGFTNNMLSFSEFVDKISKELMKENLNAAVNAADSFGLSAMSMDDISAEVQSVRNNAKNCN